MAARDAAGRYGEYGFARRLFTDPAPPPDLLLAPPEGAMLRLRAGGTRVRFSWSALAGAEAYRLVVASGPELQDEVASARVNGEDVQLTLSAPGELWWGVYAERGQERQPLFAKARRLTVGKPPPPRAEVPSSISQWGE